MDHGRKSSRPTPRCTTRVSVHSVEVRDRRSNLVGGLYGVAVGLWLFCGESMFFKTPGRLEGRAGASRRAVRQGRRPSRLSTASRPRSTCFRSAPRSISRDVFLDTLEANPGFVAVEVRETLGAVDRVCRSGFFGPRKTRRNTNLAKDIEGRVRVFSCLSWTNPFRPSHSLSHENQWFPENVLCPDLWRGRTAVAGGFSEINRISGIILRAGAFEFLAKTPLGEIRGGSPIRTGNRRTGRRWSC